VTALVENVILLWHLLHATGKVFMSYGILAYGAHGQAPCACGKINLP